MDKSIRVLKALGFVLIMLLILTCKKEIETEKPEPTEPIYTVSTGLIAEPYEELLGIPTDETIDTSNLPHYKNSLSAFSFYMPDRGYQGSNNSCAGWSVGYGMMSYHFKYFEGHDDYTGSHQVFSPGFMWNMVNNHNNKNVWLSTVLRYAKQKGCCKEYFFDRSSDYSATPSNDAIENAMNYKLTDFFRIHKFNRVKYWINKGYPVVAGFEIDSDFINNHFNKTDDNSLIWNENKTKVVGLHAMVVCGYDDSIKAYKVMNSYGQEWGNNGYIWIDYDFFEKAVRKVFDSNLLSFIPIMFVGVVQRPSVVTINTEQVSGNIYKLFANALSDAGSHISQRGFCWSNVKDPELKDNVTICGDDTGQFSATIDGLEYNTTYYAKAYAINQNGISYGKNVQFSTGEPVYSIPSLSTHDATVINLTSVQSGGIITSDGGLPITVRGVCWSTNNNPGLNDNVITSGSIDNDFICTIEPLTLNTTYYFRAFATNSAGTGFGDEKEFTTSGFSVGQLHLGGVIFYIDNTGDHGLIAALTDQSTGCNWYKSAFQPTGATATSIGSGSANTELIFSVFGAGAYAAIICHELEIGGSNDWYLPSKMELEELFDLEGTYQIDPFKEYWSSSESSYGSGAWFSSKNFGGYGNEYYTARVRAIKSF